MPVSLLIASVIEMLIMIGLPLVLVLTWCRRRGVAVTVPLIAAGFFLANLAVNTPLVLLWSRLLAGHPWLITLATAITYGVCEEVLRYLSFRTPALRRRRDAEGAVAAGLGHGGMESIVFALPYLVGMITIVLAPQLVPAGVAEQTLSTHPLLFVTTGLDRLPAMAGHVVFALLIVLAYRAGRRWWALAIVAHVALDLVMFALRDHAPTPVFVTVWVLVGLVAIVLAVRLIRRPTLQPVRPTGQVTDEAPLVRPGSTPAR